jgi:hypothetical protein
MGGVGSAWICLFGIPQTKEIQIFDRHLGCIAEFVVLSTLYLIVDLTVSFFH